MEISHGNGWKWMEMLVFPTEVHQNCSGRAPKNEELHQQLPNWSLLVLWVI
jgi:hypothetical protein